MLIFVWFCVMMSATSPSGETLARHYVGAVEDRYRAMIEARGALADEIADMRHADKRAGAKAA